MDQEFEAKYLCVEETQWWCKARRQIVFQIVRQIQPSANARILEIGCSGGLLIQDLIQSGYTNVRGIDVSSSAVGTARARGLSTVAVMDGADLGFADASFDLIIASDVLEHIQRPDKALDQWGRVLANGGKLIVFVPAFQWLWSAHDEANHHYHRFTARELRQVLMRAGFSIVRLSYWNGFLTLPGAVLNIFRHLIPRHRTTEKTGGLVQPWGPFNRALFHIIALENFALRILDFPFGTSVFAVAVVGSRSPAEHLASSI